MPDTRAMFAFDKDGNPLREQSIHPFISLAGRRNIPLDAECRLCGQHQWYRLHQTDGRPVSREEFVRRRLVGRSLAMPPADM